MPITEAKIRTANAEDQIQRRPDCLWKWVTAPVRFANRTWLTLTLKQNQDNLLKWEVPMLQSLYEATLYLVGMKPEWPHIQFKTSWLGTHVYFKDPVLVDEFFKNHRFAEGGIFSPGRGVKVIGEIIQRCFPGAELEDCIFTCSPERSKILHHLLSKKLNRTEIKAGYGVIQQKASETVRRMANSDISFQFTEEAKRYAAEVFGEILLGDIEAGISFGAFIPHFKNYLMKVYMKNNTEKDDQLLEAMIEKVRSQTNDLLEKDSIPLFDDESRELSKAQKQAMVFIAFFAAQDNTGTLLTGMAAHWYNTSEEERAHLRREAKRYFSEQNPSPFKYPVPLTNWLEVVLSKYPPVPIVGRTAEQDLCVDFRLDKQDVWHTTFIPKGAVVGAHIKAIGQQFFGDGPHRCPGKDLARIEACELFFRIIAQYDLQYMPLQNFQLALQFTGVIKPDMNIKLNPIGTLGKLHLD